VRVEDWIAANEEKVDSHAIFREWVEMHSAHNYWRREQAHTITRILESLDIDNLTIIDLGCGAGDLSEYLLQSLPNIRIIGVDHNPFLLMVYKNHLAKHRDRFSLLRADITQEEMLRSAGAFQAAVSMSCFHNLSRQNILKVCRCLCELLPKGGVFANADISTLSDEWLETINYSAEDRKSATNMMDFWQGIKNRYDIEGEIDEMLSLTRTKNIPEHGYPSSFHVNSLRWAGFKIADEVFRAGNRSVYCARKI
jgi:trans-aconitate 2-methyltransferase